MAIEFRGGGAYYYRKRREGDRVVSEYVGGGLIGLIVAQDDEDARAARAEAEAAWRAERSRMEDEDRAFAEYFDRVEALASAISCGARCRPPRSGSKPRGTSACSPAKASTPRRWRTWSSTW